MSRASLADRVSHGRLLSGSYRERGRPIVRGLVVDEEPPCQPLAAGQWQGAEVDAQRDPQFAARSYPRWTPRFELPIEADCLVSNGHFVPVLIGEVEAPMVFDVRLIPRNPNAHSYRDLLRSWSDHAQAAAKDEELAIVHLHGVCHQDDRTERWRVEGEVGLLHCDDPIGSVRAHEATR